MFSKTFPAQSTYNKFISFREVSVGVPIGYINLVVSHKQGPPCHPVDEPWLQAQFSITFRIQDRNSEIRV